ncbi:hypothetical protein ACW4TU_45535 (plasmid) [Streptomyces sp. QTS52]
MASNRRRGQRAEAIEDWRQTFGKGDLYEAWKYILHWWWASDFSVRNLSANLIQECQGRLDERTASTDLSVISLWHLRQAAAFVDELTSGDQSEVISIFDESACCLKVFRDTILHFEDYELGVGRRQAAENIGWDGAQIGIMNRSQCDCFYTLTLIHHRLDIFTAWRAARIMVYSIQESFQGRDSHAMKNLLDREHPWGWPRCHAAEPDTGAKLTAVAHCSCN